MKIFGENVRISGLYWSKFEPFAVSFEDWRKSEWWILWKRWRIRIAKSGGSPAAEWRQLQSTRLGLHNFATLLREGRECNSIHCHRTVHPFSRPPKIISKNSFHLRHEPREMPWRPRYSASTNGRARQRRRQTGALLLINNYFQWSTLLVNVLSLIKNFHRSWNRVCVVLKGIELYFYKDQESYHSAPSSTFKGEPAIEIFGASAAVASDYTKKKNVFRLR